MKRYCGGEAEVVRWQTGAGLWAVQLRRRLGKCWSSSGSFERQHVRHLSPLFHYDYDGSVRRIVLP